MPIGAVPCFLYPLQPHLFLIGRARTLCPDLQTVPYDFEGYQEVAKVLYDTVARYTLDIQAVSCDEMLVDLTSVLIEVDVSAEVFVEHLRQEVFASTGCAASVGLGPNVLLARLATREAKPDGVFHLKDEEQIESFMRKVKVGDLPGVGRKTEPRLKDMSGGDTCGDLQSVAQDLLVAELGERTGNAIFEACRGISSLGLDFGVDGGVPKSVSSEVKPMGSDSHL